ncbi:aspartyl-phosphate phosphatase Spo0E family protein, partial [Clostridium botulinum]|nr:aspartyl-phosphate phosphatase Spo0E family protein [Clostridium botulinum]
NLYIKVFITLTIFIILVNFYFIFNIWESGEQLKTKEHLFKQMSQLRQDLYKISVTLEEKDRDEEKILNLSREMDELIVQYMKCEFK